MYSQPAILNVLDDWFYNGTAYVPMIANDPTKAVQNAQVLQQIINYAQTTNCDQTATYGSIILFPGHNTLVDPTVGGTGDDNGSTYFIATQANKSYAVSVDCNWPLLFKGTGNTKLVMVVGETTPGGDIFSIQNNGDDNTGGMAFEDLTFQYPSGITADTQWAAIHLVSGGGAQNIRIKNCVFEDCPIGLWVEDGLQISMSQCLLEFTKNGNVGTCIILGNTDSNSAAKEVFITDCLFAAGKAPNGSTGIQIVGSDEIFVEDCHIDGFTNGIMIQPGPTGHNAVHLHFTGCTIYTGIDASGNLGSCCLIQPGTGTAVGQVEFVACFFELGAGSETMITGMTGPGIMIDASNGFVDSVRFIGCHSLYWPGPGLQITGSSENNAFPANVEVIGGLYSGNNFLNSDASNSYGIWVEYGSGIRIAGASCAGVYKDIKIGSTGNSPLQAYGILVDANASHVLITGCDCKNNKNCGISVNGGATDVIIDACDVTNSTTSGTNGIVVDALTTAVSGVYIRNCNANSGSGWTYNEAIAVSGSGSNVSSIQVTNCAGYNDQGYGQNLSYPLVGTATFYPALFSYWGPIEVYIGVLPGLSTVSITIDSTTIPIKSGSFLLVPGETATVNWAPSSDTLSAAIIGK